MFTEISWGEYLITTLIITILYYLAVLFLKFRMEIKNLFHKGSSRQAQVEDINSSEDSNMTLEFSKGDTPTGLTQEADWSEHDSTAVDEFITLIQETLSSRRNLDKNVMEQLLRELFSNYSNIKHSAYRSSINEFTISEGEKYGHVMPSEVEIDVLWNEQA
ncbi:hypothetical protein ACFSQ3_08820 [Sphingobacterium corticis]|uniref:Uncharacterized protein n=1 Tax=Sphingobacterium corticis TaxID=1812823 RepID=A0ABW5NLY9_9SPHI